jgi:hypothetical protein
MDQQEMVKFVEELVAVCPYRLTLRFNTGEVRVVDLEPALRAKAVSAQSAYGQLLEPATFSRARLDPEARTVCWDGLARELTSDGVEQPAPLDLCPDVLYELSTPFAQNIVGPAAQEAKPTEASDLILKDEPPRQN